MSSERVLVIVIVLVILGAAGYFAVSKFTNLTQPPVFSSPTPTPNLTFYLQTSTPSPQSIQPQSSVGPGLNQISTVQTGPTNTPQPGELPLLKNKNLGKFPGMLTEEELKNKAVTMVTSKGNLVIEIYQDSPKAASNFLLLASNGFYDNLTFHRVEPGLLIQGGDPKGDGTGDGGYTFEDELNDGREYIKGTVAMANRGPNTNSTQFFIVIADKLDIPKKYTIFGTIIFGMDVVERIAPKDTIYKAVIQPLR